MNTQTNEVTAPAKAAKKVTKAAPAPKGPVIKLTDKTPSYKDGSARAVWYAAIAKANGKAAEEFVEAATKKPPVLKKDGKGEPPMGWLRYFQKEGVLELAPAKQ